MGRKSVRVAAVLAALAFAVPTGAATRPDSWNLHPGSHGPRVAALQWLLSGHRPNVFTKIRPTLMHYTAGVYGARTKAAVAAYKYRLGYPNWQNAQVGPYFFRIVEGKAQRPLIWVALAQKRVRVTEPGATKVALQIKQLEVSQLGVHEIPDGSNRGPCISVTCRIGVLGLFGPYQGSTGAYGAAWCASFQQWAFASRGPGTFADRSAGVLYIEGWAQKHGYLNAKAKVGSLVAFLDDGGHIGYVTKVLASGYVTIEGNEGNSVKQVYHPWNDRLRVFINIPGVA